MAEVVSKIKSKIMAYFPTFDAKTEGTDVFLKLEYVKKEQMHFDDLLKAIKNDFSGQSNFVGTYVYRSNDSYMVIGHFRSLPKFSASVGKKFQTTVLTQNDLTSLENRQFYTINKKGYPTLVHIHCQYGIDYFFNQRKVKQHENLTVLNVYNPNEHVANLDFSFNNALFTVDEKSIVRRNVLHCRDVRVGINEEAERAFNSADESAENKNFRDYSINDIVLIKHAGYVRRGCVLSCNNNICEILCVDYGIKLRCSISQLRIASPEVAYTRFLAIPCVLNGIGHSPSQKVRKYVNELINQLDRSSAELVVLNKNERALQHVDISFTEKTGEKISIAKYLEKAGLIKTSEPNRVSYVYDFGEMLRLVKHARPMELSPEKVDQIKRPFVNPKEFLSTNTLAKTLGISA
ncbi:hypothetical protein M3Y97_00058000 [Aphelenchoides bicaudatus]|nr:hypothetical protein M3Y97_00058000 [Aphelenchoides bicaudatus]